MANNQPADEQADGLPILARPAAASEAVAADQSAAMDASSQKTGRTPRRHLDSDETTPLNIVEDVPGARPQHMGTSPSASSDSEAVASGTPDAGLRPESVTRSDKTFGARMELPARREPRASVTIIEGAQAVSRPSGTPLAAQPSAQSLDADAPLGARPVMRLLLVSDAVVSESVVSESGGSSAAQIVYKGVVQLGHAVEAVASDDWQRMLSEAPPEVILLDPGLEQNLTTSVGHSASTGAQQVCRQLREHSEADGCLLVVLLPNPQSTLDAGAWELWQRAGAHVILETEVSLSSLQSHLELWARLVRLQRDANALRQTLVKQVKIDDLTQLLNRRFFFQAAHLEASRARRYNHPLACLMVDVNHLKLYNRTFGYACGDHILRTVASTIRAWTRESDILARFDAKKFVILLPETDVEGAMVLHEKLQRLITDSDFFWGGQKLPLTISIGEAERHRVTSTEVSPSHQALTPEDESRLGGEDDDNTPLSVREELADLLGDADAALYVAKKGVRSPNFPANPQKGDEVIGILGSN